MLKMKKLILILLLMGTSTNVLAEWSFTLAPPENGQRISDEPMEFKLGHLSCGISKTEFLRIDGIDQLSEYRRLYCKSTDGTSFSVLAYCDFPLYISTQLLIERGAVKFYPTLKCGPSKPKRP
jgi:hypothetical protein